MESRTQGSRPRTKKNPRPRTDFPRTEPLEAKKKKRSRPRTKDTKRRCSQKKRSPRKKIAHFSLGEILGVFQKSPCPENRKFSVKFQTKEKKFMILTNFYEIGLFLTNQKVVQLFSDDDRAFSRTRRLRVRGPERSWGLNLCKKCHKIFV